MAGRKPKPTQIKMVTGNPGKRPLNESEPQPDGNLYDPPDWFNDEQKKGWRYALATAPLGLLKLLDRGALTVWVVAESLHRQATIEMATVGGLIVKAPSGTPMQNPYLPIVNRQAEIMLRVIGELGFSPASRPRITIDLPQPKRAAGGPHKLAVASAAQYFN